MVDYRDCWPERVRKLNVIHITCDDHDDISIYLSVCMCICNEKKFSKCVVRPETAYESAVRNTFTALFINNRKL